MQNINSYSQHVEKIKNYYYKVIEESNFEKILIHSGDNQYYFQDDQNIYFRANPQFLHICPFNQTNQFLLIDPKESKIKLYSHTPKDFWHKVTDASQLGWANEFEIYIFDDIKKLHNEITKLSAMAFLGKKTNDLAELKMNFNPEDIVSAAHWVRSYKSKYEIEHLKCANEIALKGHKVAKEAYFSGSTEREIYFEYAKTTNMNMSEFAYPPIIAFDKNAGVLHYQQYSNNKASHSFLIDAGAKSSCFTSDITRTYTADNSETGREFAELIGMVEKAQLALCDEVKIGNSYVDLHASSRKKIAKILNEAKILKKCSVDEIIENKYVDVFYPHGIGHMLGIQTHDVTGKIKNSLGEKIEMGQDFPYLRNYRIMEENQVFTIEPGLYFIDVLLEPYSSNSHFNFEKINTLKKYGGIRIEDNIVVTKDGHNNLTRN